MSGIRLVNQREDLVPVGVKFAAGANPTALAITDMGRYQPTATKILAAVQVPGRGVYAGGAIVVCVAGAKGASADLKCQYRIKRVDQNFGNAVVLSGLATPLDVTTTPVLAPVAGTRLTMPALSASPAPLLLNDYIVFEYVESGTFNADTRPIIALVSLKWRAIANLDPEDIGNK